MVLRLPLGKLLPTKTTPIKLTGFEFWRKSLKGARHVVAPMVDQSEEAWRMLSRRYGAQLCYTPMLHARLFLENEYYREEQFTTNPEDRPLIAQFCANDPETLLKAALLVQDKCDAIDLNIGCPQQIAKKGRYGSFLMEDWELLKKMVNLLHHQLTVPVTCKIRIFPEVSKTIEYVKMLEEAGAQLLAVHGRIREQKGHKTGLADWEQIRRIREVVSIPVFANGSILYHEDVQKCIDYTGVEGVMSAEGNLYNPAIFSGQFPPTWEIAQEYLDICKTIPTKFHMVRPHLFKIFRPCLYIHTDMRDRLGKAKNIEQFEEIVGILKQRLEEAARCNPHEITFDTNGTRIIPHWLCQPYFRPPFPEVINSKTEVNSVCAREDSTTKLIIKTSIRPRKLKKSREDLCNHCRNIASTKCSFQSCKKCCRENQTCHQCEVHNYVKSPTTRIESEEFPALITATL